MASRSLTSEQARALQRKRTFFTEEEIQTILMAMVEWSGNASAAARYLKTEKGIKITPQTLSGWVRGKHAIRFNELREQASAQMEASLAHEFRDRAMQANDAVRLAVEKSTERLESGEDHDPARSAANLSKVAHVSVDKLMTLTQRPSEIRETRNADELVRSLAALGVLRIPDAEVVEAKQLEPGEPDDGEP